MDMHDVLESLKAGDEQSVLATIICVEGHSYRKAGASMLFKLSGEQIGSVSPGCLEHDLMERAANIWDSEQFALISYNLNADEDAIWGEAVGCGGEICVLLEPVKGQLQQLLLDAKWKNDAGASVKLTRSWKGQEMSYMLVEEVVDGNEVDYKIEQENSYLSIVITPRPRLVLFGIGNDSIAIYSLVQKIGFRIIAADWRPSLCTKEQFPEAECVVGSPEQIAQQIQFRSDDYLIVCSHHLQQDKEMIRLALPLQLAYIGILGSKKRIRMLFETFLIPSNVRAPIGLSIDADGPYEIAVSVAAELIAVRAERKRRSRGETGRDADFSAIFSSRTKQTYGRSQAVARTGER